jgi:GNAT superfamily N-acetyltransferase
MVEYQLENKLRAEEFKDVLIRSTLGKRRPIDDLSRLSAMLKNADYILTARVNGQLIGIARTISDFSYCSYLSDLAVDQAYQRKGIGKELIKRTKELSEPATLILLAAPEAEAYYPRIGMTHTPQCFTLKEIKNLK